MAGTGVIFKRCGCRDLTGKRLEKSCPRLTERAHGSWYFHACATNVLGRSERLRRGGYPSQTAARRARDEWLATTGEERTARSWTVERWLRYWLSTRTHLRPTSLLHYTRDVEQILIPRLGHLRLADLDAALLRTTFTEIAKTTNRRGQPQSAAAMQHLRTTLCAALNLAVREGLLASYPARHIEVTGYRRPHAQVWTDDRVALWQATGQRPVVAVWTAAHLATFLTTVVGDGPFACGGSSACAGCVLRWSEVDLDRGVLFIVRNRTTAGYRVVEGPPKTAAGTRASRWTSTPCRCCASTATGRPSNAPAAPRPARSGTIPATYSSVPTAPRSTPATPAAASACWSARSTSHRSGSMTCATAPRP